MTGELSDIRSDRPIGVFDSGLGGLTVVGALRAALPAEDLIYLGDTARVPYGTKSLRTVRSFALDDTAFLLRFRPKLIVVACNTASAAAKDAIESAADVPVVDVIGPGVAAALAQTDGPVGVIATEATICSGAYERAIHSADPSREVIGAACPLLAPIVEEGRRQDDPIVLHVLCDYLHKLQRRRPGVLILGCTHYPLLAGAISKLMGPGTILVNSAESTALEVRRRLCETGSQRSATPDGEGGSLRCFTTGDPQRFAALGERFAGEPVRWVRQVGTDELQGETLPEME